MATLQKFKLLATQCAVAGSPSRSPTASPVIHLRRRKTLRMLLSRGGGGNGSSRRLPPRSEKGHSLDGKCKDSQSPEKDKDRDKDIGVVSHKLKDLFVSSPPPFEGRRVAGDGGGQLFRGMGVRNCDVQGSPVVLRRGFEGVRQLRPLSATIRQRLLRRVWRPALVAIPEDR